MAKTGQSKQTVENRRGDTFGGWIYLAPAVRDFMNVLFSSAEPLLLNLQTITFTKRMQSLWHCYEIRRVCAKFSAWFVAASCDRDITIAVTARTRTRQITPYRTRWEAA